MTHCMTQLQPRKYSLKEINEISFDGFVCHIPQETLFIINDLAAKVGSPTYVKTPIFNKRNGITNNLTTTKMSSIIRPNKKKLQPTEILNDDDWDTIRSFEITKIEQKVGFDIEIVNIRSLLNMMTEKNYIEKKMAIKELLDKIYSNGDLDNIQLISNIICDIASENRFYSEIYATLYNELCSNNPIMLTILTNRIEHYMDCFKEQKLADLSDYDQLCKLNKENDRVKAFSSFIMNIVKIGTINANCIIELVNKLFQEFFHLILTENKKTFVDEIVENISILYKKAWFEGYFIDSIFGNLSYHGLIQHLATLKIKQYPSITNKAIFKFMDILDV